MWGNCTFSDFEIRTPPRALIISVPSWRSNSRGSSSTTKASFMIACLLFFRWRLMGPTPHVCIPSPTVIALMFSFCHNLHIFLPTMVQVHPESTSAIHCFLHTSNLTIGSSEFTDWKGARVVMIPCTQTHFLNSPSTNWPYFMAMVPAIISQTISDLVVWAPTFETGDIRCLIHFTKSWWRWGLPRLRFWG